MKGLIACFQMQHQALAANILEIIKKSDVTTFF
jgi:hypothetical protein